MGSAPIFFSRSKMDISLGTALAITITDSVASDNGESFSDLVRNRNNRSGWATTGSTDAANTTFTVTWNDEVSFDNLFLVLMNFKAFTVKYWDGAAYVNFSTAISETNNMTPTKRYTFDEVTTTRIQIIITGTMSTDDDKFMRQLIVCSLYGQFTTQFALDNVVLSQTRKVTQLLSGKSKITRNVGAFQCTFQKKNVSNGSDLTLIEDLYSVVDGFLVWLCGGDESQFRNVRVGYRYEDIFLCDFKTEYNPDWAGGFYMNGIDVKFTILEIG